MYNNSNAVFGFKDNRIKIHDNTTFALFKTRSDGPPQMYAL